MTGTVRALAVPQLPQTAYGTLQTPYTLSGLGRPANYVDYLFLGIQFFAFTLLPNSKSRFVFFILFFEKKSEILRNPPKFCDCYWWTTPGVPLRPAQGKTEEESGHWFKWPGLIPNSQIVAIPYPPTTPSAYVFFATVIHLHFAFHCLSPSSLSSSSSSSSSLPSSPL